MKQLALSLIFLCVGLTEVGAQNASSLSWANVCAGKMPAEWYGSDEARQIADIVLSVQKNSGGWMKNDELHKLTDSQLKTLQNQRAVHSCLDNSATTMEMRFLAKVWQKTKEAKYQQSFIKALNMIFTAEKGCGGWSQYWPLSGSGSYQDYITFNDDLMTNIMRLLQEIGSGKGDFAGIVDDATRQKCTKSIDKALEVILKCQVNDNGTPAAWCAQHDTTTFLPTEGRPHELPSISGSESASLLSYLMTIEKPSKELQQAIHTAVAWLDAHKIEGKAVEDFTNANGEKDRRIVDREGSAVWGRFIQLGGETGQATYDSFFNKLKKRGKSRSYTQNGKTYTYTEYEIATKSYDATKAYQPIFAIYDDTIAHLFYRFLYSYEDAPEVTDWKGCTVPTSLNALRRTKYQFMGSWPLNVIKNEYPAWCKRMEAQEASEDYQLHTLSSDTYTGSTTKTDYAFDGGITVSNKNDKAYGTGKSSTVKYSANVNYTVTLPAGVKISKVQFYGYDNYDEEAYIKSFNGKTFAATDYVFPAKSNSGEFTYVSHTLTADALIENSFTFSIGSKQCCIVLTLYEPSGATAITVPVATNADGTVYTLQGLRTTTPTKGIYIQNNRKYYRR